MDQLATAERPFAEPPGEDGDRPALVRPAESVEERQAVPELGVGRERQHLDPLPRRDLLAGEEEESGEGLGPPPGDEHLRLAAALERPGPAGKPLRLGSEPLEPALPARLGEQEAARGRLRETQLARAAPEVGERGVEEKVAVIAGIEVDVG